MQTHLQPHDDSTPIRASNALPGGRAADTPVHTTSHLFGQLEDLAQKKSFGIKSLPTKLLLYDQTRVEKTKQPHTIQQT